MSFEPNAGPGDEIRPSGNPGDAGQHRPEAIAPGRALIRIEPARHPRFAWSRRHGVWAAGFALAIGAGAAGLQTVRSLDAPAAQAVKVADIDPTAQLLHRLQDEITRLKGSVDTLRASNENTRQDDTLRGLRKSVESLKQELEQVRSNNGTVLAQLSSKLDKPDRDPTARLAEIATRLDKLDRDPAQKLADVTSRLDRIERQVASPTVTGSIPPTNRVAAVVPAPTPAPVVAAQPPQPLPRPAAVVAKVASKPDVSAVAATPSKTASKADAPVSPAVAGKADGAAVPAVAGKVASKPEASVVAAADPRSAPAKAPTVDGWVVRDVYDGLALVEARRGGLREIAPGEYLPGAGEVRSIERRGRSWVVMTSRGMIEASTW